MNIPICDVGVDPDYEKNVSATFQLPNSYLRHSKKIGDEVDISIDYNMDSQDIVSLYSTFYRRRIEMSKKSIIFSTCFLFSIFFHI